MEAGISMSKTLVARVRDGDVVYGPFMKLAAPQVVEIAGLAGFDFVICDTEHGSLSFESIENLVRAAQVAGIAPLVRVYESSPALVSRALDTGAQGILVPQICSREEAESLAQACRFAPMGQRGVCRYVRAAQYTALDRYSYFSKANAETLVVAMIEGKEGIGNLPQIIDTPGIDVLFVGPYDLSQSLGMPGQVESPAVEEQMTCIARMARSRGLAVGTFVDDAVAARRWVRAGFQFISFSVDVGIIYKAMKDSADALRR